MTRATLDSWCSCGVRGTAVHMVGECPRTGTPAPQSVWDPASQPPAATATCPHGWPPMSPTQTAPCLLCEVAALRAELVDHHREFQPYIKRALAAEAALTALRAEMETLRAKVKP